MILILLLNCDRKIVHVSSYIWTWSKFKTNVVIKLDMLFKRNESMCGISHDKIVETSLMMSWMLRMSSSSSHALVVCFGPNGQECQKELWCVIAACLSSLTYNLSLMTDTFMYEFIVWLLTSKYIYYVIIVYQLI